jgi:hypothetical protein
MADPTPDQPKSQIEDQIRGMFRQGGYAEAVDVIKVHLSGYSDDVPAYELLADALRYSGDKAGAAAALQTASELWALAGNSLLSVAAQKKAMKLGVEPDWSAIRALRAKSVGSQRIPTPLFDDFQDDEFSDVVELLETRSFEPGEAVVEEGTVGDALFVLVRGTLEVTTRAGGSDMKLAELSVGDFFGESALLSGRPRTATIKATAPSECLVLSRLDYDRLAQRHPHMREVMADFNKRRAASTIEALVKKRHP